jgi:hypothetical protein
MAWALGLPSVARSSRRMAVVYGSVRTRRAGPFSNSRYLPKTSDQVSRNKTPPISAALPDRSKDLGVDTLSERAFIGETLLDRFKKRYTFERLSDKACGADRERFVLQMIVGQGRDQDHRRSAILFTEPSYEVESIHSRHVNVRDCAIENGKIGRRQKRLCGRKRLSSIANGAHEVHQARAKVLVVVDDRNERAIHQMQPRAISKMVSTRRSEDVIPSVEAT